MSQFVSQVLPLLYCFFFFLLFSLPFLLFNKLSLSQKVLHKIHNVGHLSFTHKLKIQEICCSVIYSDSRITSNLSLGAELLVPLAVHLPHLRLLALQGQPDLFIMWSKMRAMSAPGSVELHQPQRVGTKHTVLESEWSYVLYCRWYLFL